MGVTMNILQDKPCGENGRQPRVALIHYWLVNMRGGERVLEALCRMFPQADIFTHVLNREALSPLLRQKNIQTTFIQKIPGSVRHYQKLLPLMPLALEQLDLTGYDLVISSESGPAKGVLTRADCPHLCYCHSPMRYLWDFYPQYLASASALTRFAMRPLCSRLRLWDVISANRVDHFVANSATVARRIRKHWRRDSTVVHPPVDVHNIPLGPRESREDYYLCLGQLVDYKKAHLAVEACTRLQKKLIVVGDGECRARLQSLAGPSVIFEGRADHAGVLSHYTRCKALLFPGEEDFGMVPVEAMAAGTPVLAYGRGGATETVLDGQTGLFFQEQTTEALCATIQDYERCQDDFDPVRIRAHALNFDEARFAAGMEREIERVMRGEE